MTRVTVPPGRDCPHNAPEGLEITSALNMCSLQNWRYLFSHVTFMVSVEALDAFFFRESKRNQCNELL